MKRRTLKGRACTGDAQLLRGALGFVLGGFVGGAAGYVAGFFTSARGTLSTVGFVAGAGAGAFVGARSKTC